MNAIDGSIQMIKSGLMVFGKVLFFFCLVHLLAIHSLPFLLPHTKGWGGLDVFR